MKHALFAAVVALYVVIVAQNWAVYTAALLVATWVRNGGRLASVPFSLGRARARTPR
jgi:hypothetical protein